MVGLLLPVAVKGLFVLEDPAPAVVEAEKGELTPLDVLPPLILIEQITDLLRGEPKDPQHFVGAVFDFAGGKFHDFLIFHFFRLTLSAKWEQIDKCIAVKGGMGGFPLGGLRPDPP